MRSSIFGLVIFSLLIRYQHLTAFRRAVAAFLAREREMVTDKLNGLHARGGCAT
jgi:hypothetical protein